MFRKLNPLSGTKWLGLGPHLLFFDFGRLRCKTLGNTATVRQTVDWLGDAKEPHSLSDKKKKHKV